MGRPRNPNVPEDGYISKRQFEESGSIAGSDFAVVSDYDNHKKVVLNPDAQDTNTTIHVLSPHISSDINVTWPSTSGTLAIGTAGNAFGIVQPDHGTSPTATLPNDTLTITSSNSTVTVTGNSSTNTIDLVVPDLSAITSLTGDVSATGPGAAAATVNSIGGSSAANVHSAELLANAATSASTASAIIKRGTNKEFASGAITEVGVIDTVQLSVKGFSTQTSDILDILKSDNTNLFKVTNAGAGTFSGSVTASNFSGTASGTNTGDQTITLTGDVTGSGTGSFATTISVGAVTDTKASLLIKPAVAVVATTNQTLSGTPTVDGVATAVNTLILLTAQSAPAENGPWTAQSGAWVRPTWYPAGGTTQALQFMTTFVRLGTLYKGSTWRQTAASPITIDTTATTWVITQLALNPTTALKAPVALSDAATVATNASLGNHFRVTLGGNRTLGNPTSSTDGQYSVWEIIQDATGNRTLTLDTKFSLGSDIFAVVLSTVANKRDFLGAIYNSTADKWYITAFVRGY